MKSFLLFLFSAGVVSSQLLFSPGSEYVYTYSGKILSGIPELDSTFAGLSLSGKVILQATSQNTFKLAMKEVGFSQFNEKFSGMKPFNWRNVVTPATSPVIGMAKQYMESPVEFSITTGDLTSVKVSSSEPEWSVNFKKALITALKIQLPAQQTGEVPSFWVAMEEGIEGKCENTYQVTPLPEYLVKEYKEMVINPTLCQGKKFYEIEKARDITKCVERSVFMSSKAHKKCLLGNCDGVNTKSSVTKYFGCGESISTIQLHGIINEGELQQNVFAFNTEPVVTGTKQTLKLSAVKPLSTAIPSIQSPVTLKDLLYMFPKPAEKLMESHQQLQQHYQQLRKDPSIQTFLPEGSVDKISREEIKRKVVEKLSFVASQLAEIEHFGKKEIPSQLKSLKTVISILTTEDLNELYTIVKSYSAPKEIKDTMRTLLLETVRMAGTSPSVVFIKKMIEVQELSDMEAFMAITTLPHNIKTPTIELIDQVFELIKSPVIKKNELLKIHAHLVFATIVQKSCLVTPVNAVFPEHIFGEMCSADHSKLTQVYIPYFVKELKATTPGGMHQSGALSVLAILGHESVIPIVIEYIEGKAHGVSLGGRKMAIYSLADVAMKYRNTLMPVFASLFHNPSEERGVRIAAFSMMMRMKPSTTHLQKLAVSTWYEQDAEVHKFIHSSLKTLAYIDLAKHPRDSLWKDLTIKAQTVLPLAKSVPGIISSTFNSYISDVLKNLHVGSQLFTGFITQPSGYLVYHRTEQFMKQLQTIPMEFSADVRGLKALTGDLIKTITGQSENYMDKIHPEWKNIVQSLEISSRADTPFEFDFWAKFSDDIQLILGANTKIVDMIKEKIEQAMKNPATIMGKLCGQTPININKVFEFLPYQAVVPSDLGLPIIVETQMTSLISLKGSVNLVCEKPSLTINVAKKAAYTYNGYVGTVSPFTQELVAAGINAHRAVNIPLKGQLEVVPNTHTLKIVMQQVDAVTPSTTVVDLHHYHVKPFTAMKPLVFVDLTPIVLHKNTKIINSMATPKIFQLPLGETVGLNMALNVETQCDVYDRKTLIDSWANYKFNPFMAGLFYFTETAITSAGKPSARPHTYTISHNPSVSSTKQAEIAVTLDFASMMKQNQPKKMQWSQSKIQSSALSTSSSQEKSLEYSIKQLKAEKAIAVHALVQASLMGGQSKTYSYSLTVGVGSNIMEHKWNLHLETQSGGSPLKMCVDGSMKYPMASDITLKYLNKISFGSTCEQYSINIEGTATVSDKQQEYSSQSEEAQQCSQLNSQCQKLIQQLKSTVDQQQKSQLEQQYSKEAIQRDQVCSSKKHQSVALDQVVVVITTSDELPEFVSTYGYMINTGLKAMLLPYMSRIPDHQGQQKILVQANFNQKLNTVSVKVESPTESVIYENIRLPSALQNILPLSREKISQGLTGSSLYPTCTIGQGYVQTYDQKSYAYQVDQCDHVLSSDCSSQLSHSVLVKEVNGMKHVTVYSDKTKVVLRPADSYSPYAQNYVMEFNGEVIPVDKNSPHFFVKDESILSQFMAYWCPFQEAVVLHTPYNKVIYSSKMVKVQEKTVLSDGNMCGLCGDANQDMRGDLSSPKQCVYSSYGLSALSYRVKNSQCSLSSAKQQQIEAEESTCAKKMIMSSPLQSLVSQQGSSSMMKHSYTYHQGKICISQQPVVQCSSGYSPTSVTSKSVKFVCLPEGRVSKLYAERIERGESPQELKHQPIAWEAVMAQPVGCGPKV